ncbi:MAG: hypothetical protein CHACPFDD_00179 [Phycisphaerae bacterium]|nr:hypothetical protein [Phycisphaerae bacterium]
MSSYCMRVSAIVLIAAASMAANEKPVRFRVAPNHPSGLWPWAVATGDVNGDGLIDFVTADIDVQESGVPAKATISFNNGDGTFSTARYSVGEAPRGVALADFNHDGRLDIVTSDTWNDRAAVLLSKADGTYAAAKFVASTWTAQTVRTADFNNDGWEDFAIAGEVSNQIRVHRNNAAGGFVNGGTLNTGNGGVTIAVGDLNRDGWTDVVAADDRVLVYRNQGNGTFAAAVSYPTSAYAMSDLVVADFDGDNWPDVAGTAGAIHLLRNNGDGTLGAETTYDNGSWMMTAADLNADGYPDIAGGNYLANSVSVLFADGAGGFRPQVNWGGSDQLRCVGAGDFDGDGLVDLIAPSADSHQMQATLFINAGDETFVARRDYPLIDSATGVALADFDGDGYLDATIPVYRANQNVLGFLYGVGDGTFESPVYTPHWGNMQPTGVTVADFNRDGRPDVAASVFSPGNGVLVFYNLGNRSFSAPDFWGAGGNPSAVAAADLDGDAWDDLVVVNGSQLDNTITVLFNNQDGFFVNSTFYDVGLRPGGAAIGDWDGDGDNDVVVTNSTNAVNLMYNDGFGNLSRVDRAVGAAQGTPKLVDMDADGFFDLVLATGVVTLMRNDHQGGFSGPEFSTTFASSVAVADFDADGDADVIGSYPVLSQVYVAINDGAGILTDQAEFFEAGYGCYRLNAGDLDGDGLPELLTANFEARSISVLRNITRLVGDLNCDGSTNGFDVDAFVLALTDPAAYAAAYPNCDIRSGDVNADGTVNGFDVDPFVGLLGG